jgi:AraC family transcriptional regulator
VDKIVSLDRGCYLGHVANMCNADGIIISTTIYEKEALTSQAHYHENPHLSFSLQGGSKVKRIGKETELVPGDIEFCYAGETHQTIQKIFPSKNINLEIDIDFLKKHEIPEATVHKAIAQNPDGKFLLLKMYKELMANDNSSSTSIRILFFDLISKFEKPTPKTNVPFWVTQIHEFMHEHWNKKITLNDLSIATNLNPITISKHFRKYFSCTFGEYVRKLKIEKSLAMIKSRKSLTDIAHECDFADQSHFTRTFKQLTGFLPKHYERLKDS